MKNIARLSAVLFLILAISFPVFGGEKSAKLPVIQPPTLFTNHPPIVRPKEVYYWVDDLRLGVFVSVSFTADHSGKLKNFRVVMNDQTVYDWDVPQDGGGLSDWENGDNKVTINRPAWVKFFEKKVVLPAFEFQEDNSTFRVYTRQVEFVGWDIKKGGGGIEGASFKVEGATALINLSPDKFLFPFPDGKFFLGAKDDKFIPLQKEGEGWRVVSVGKPEERKEFPLSQ